MRKIDKIIIHCSATKPNQDIGVKQINKWHKANGWSECGYHYIVRLNGEIEVGRPLDKPGAHCKGQNRNSIGVCLIGGLDASMESKNTFNKKQFTALKSLLASLQNSYPNVGIHGHNEFSSKACPCFSIKDWLAKLNKDAIIKQKEKGGLWSRFLKYIGV